VTISLYEYYLHQSEFKMLQYLFINIIFTNLNLRCYNIVTEVLKIELSLCCVCSSYQISI
jgi:hypothetical protein